MATYNSSAWLKVTYNSQEVKKIILNSTTAWEEPSQLPSVPYAVWGGDVNVSKNSVISTINPITYSKTGTVFKIVAPDFGDIYCTQNSSGKIIGTIYPTGEPPVNGQYFVRMTPNFELINNGTQIKFNSTEFAEGGSYPNADYLDDSFLLWITSIEVVSW